MTAAASIRIVPVLLGALAAALAPSAARANCARPVGYAVTVSGSTVEISAASSDGRACPDPGGLLRQDLATGETVRLADFCAAAPAFPDLGLPYLDECVPSGRYRYGFAQPFACDRSACSTSYFEEAAVLTPLDPACQRSAGSAAPTPAGPPPWGSSPTVCTYQSTAWDDAWRGAFGCSTLPAGSGAVLLLDGAVLALGLAVLRRRSRR